MNPSPRVLIFDRHKTFSAWFSKSLPEHYSVSFVSSEASLENGTDAEALLVVEEHGLESAVVSWAAGHFAHAIILRIMSDNPVPDHQGTSIRANIQTSPWDAQILRETIESWIDASLKPQEKSVEITKLLDQSSFVRSSARMLEIDAQARLVAQANIPILILGESGTGKEVLAKYIHMMSERKNKMFLKVNCAAMPTDLLESELFGHEQGAFTGAVKARAGKFEICDGGTIFLDEIGEMPPLLQAKLLHVLQDGSFSRLGARAPMKSDVRVIAATNVDVKSAIAGRSFREDLYYRLNGFSFTIPPLRDRPEEIPAFAKYFMTENAAKYGRSPRPMSDALIQIMVHYDWPGNLRELQNVITRFLLIGSEEDIRTELSDKPVRSSQEKEPAQTPAEGLKQLARNVKGSAESAAIAAALEETHWNRKAAAKMMKISYKALLYKIKQYEIAPSRAE